MIAVSKLGSESRQDFRPRRKPKLLTSFATGMFYFLLFFSVGCNSNEDEASKDSPVVRPITVRTAVVTRADITPDVRLVGTVTAIRRSTLGSRVEGFVTKVLVDEGDRVGMVNDGKHEQGMPIALLDTEMISIEISAAQAQLEQLQQELAQLNAGSLPQEIAQAKARWDSAKDASEYADTRFLRAKSLTDSQAISNDKLESAKSVAFAAKQELIESRAAYELAVAGPRSEQIAQAVAKVKQQDQEIARLQTQLRYHTIRAPFDGYVVRKRTEIGQWLTRGAPVVELVGLDPIEVVVHVPETLVTQIETGDKVPLKFDALPTDRNYLEGTILGINASADQKSRTFPVRIRLKNPMSNDHYLLRDGMQARATLSGRPRSATLVPKDALVLGGPKPVVMVVEEQKNEQPIAVKIEVEAGVSQAGLIEVYGDIQPGQQVIVRGNERVRAGQFVHIVADSTADELKKRER